MKSFKFKKTLAFTVLLTFIGTQIVTPQELQVTNQSTLQPVKEPTVTQSAQEKPPQPIDPFPQTTEQFLQDTLTLTPASEEISEEINDSVSNSEIATANLADFEMTQKITNRTGRNEFTQNYEYDRYDFEDALDLLRPEYASAVIVKDLKEEDLRALLDLPLETGILVLDGEIILFTSGSKDEIGVLPAVKALVEKASFMSHTHPTVFSEEGPTSTDLEEAVSNPDQEYVISHKGVYAYNQDGVLNNGEPNSYDWYLDQLNQALQASRKESNQVQARADLNQFITVRYCEKDQLGPARGTLAVFNCKPQDVHVETQRLLNVIDTHPRVKQFFYHCLYPL